MSIHQHQNTETLSFGRRLNNKTSDYFAFCRTDNISSIKKSPTATEIHWNSPFELQVYHMFASCCIMSLLSTQQNFPLQVKRICRDSSLVTLMSFGVKLSCQPNVSLTVLDPQQNSGLRLFLQLFAYCEAVRHVISVES